MKYETCVLFRGATITSTHATDGAVVLSSLHAGTECGHNADRVRAECGHSRGTVRTGCGQCTHTLVIGPMQSLIIAAVCNFKVGPLAPGTSKDGNKANKRGNT